MPQSTDPLADLRDGTSPQIGAGAAEPPAAAQLPEVLEVDVAVIRPMVSQEVWDDMVVEMVTAWHTDPTSQGFLHGGGQCGCRYIAQRALQVAVPVAEEDPEEGNGE